METHRRALTAQEARQVRFWVDALLHAEDPAQAAQAAGELHSLGVRTRGAVRTRGSVQASAQPRLPVPPAAITRILGKLREQETPEMRREVVAALAEWGGGAET